MSHYEILGIPSGADDNRVSSAYKSLALKWHPDRHLHNKEGATDKFVEINKAYRTVLRERRRARRSADTASENTSTCSSSSSSTHEKTFPPPTPPSSCFSDVTTESSPSTSSSSTNTSSSSATPSRKAQQPPTHPSNMYATPISPCSFAKPASKCGYFEEIPEPIFYANATSTSSFSSTQSELPSTASKSTRGKLRKQSRPYDNRPDTSNSEFIPKASSRRRKTEDAAESAAVDSPSPERVLLPDCDPRLSTPTEWVHVVTMTLEELFQGKQCYFRAVRHKLSGATKNVLLDVNVPPGCQDGTKIIFRDAGHERKDGTRQDIVFLIKEAVHERFERIGRGADLVTKMQLPWVDSLEVNGGEVHIEGVDGEDIVIPVNFPRDKLLEGTESVLDAGMPLNDGSGRGRLIVRWEIHIPSTRWDSLKQAFRFKH